MKNNRRQIDREKAPIIEKIPEEKVKNAKSQL